MHCLQLPEAHGTTQPAFLDLAGAEHWLAGQPQTQALPMLAALSEQIEAIDAANLAPALVIELLDRLRRAAIPLQASLEARYARKALPLPAEEQRAFDTARQLWTRLGIAYLRRAPHFGAAEKCLPLQRAANALRLAQFCHYQASQESPPLLDSLLIAVLVQAESSGILRQALGDPDYPHLGQANIAGLLSWAFLLRMIDPYHLSAAQLTVTNRALSRWRELCNFESEPDPDAKGYAISLADLLGVALPESGPNWLNVRPVGRKIRSRVESLRAGEGPEALKLGRELSGPACIRLLTDLARHLRKPAEHKRQSIGEIELAFGAEHAYAMFTGDELNPRAGLSSSGSSIAHQRMALFGFNSLSEMPTAIQRIDVPSETWSRFDGRAIRLAENGPRLQAPCLIATMQDRQARLGVLSRLMCHVDGKLSGKIDWYEDKVEACTLKRIAPSSPGQTRSALFLLRSGEETTLIVPLSAGVRLDIGVTLEGASLTHLVPKEVIERGIDFVRYTCRPA